MFIRKFYPECANLISELFNLGRKTQLHENPAPGY